MDIVELELPDAVDYFLGYWPPAVAAYWDDGEAMRLVFRPRGDQRWSTFLRNHTRAIIACDFCVAVISTFRVLYVLVVIEHHSRRLIHFNVTAHPIAQWTRQQLREALGGEEHYAYLVHDRVIGTIRRECLDWIVPLSEAPSASDAQSLGDTLRPRTSAHSVGPRRS